MSIDRPRLEDLITKIRDTKHSACILEAMVVQDMKSHDTPEKVLEAAAFYGDHKKIATFVQLVVVRTLLVHSKGKEEWAIAALEQMDQLAFLLEESTGYKLLDVLTQNVPPQEQRDTEESQDHGC